MKTSFIALTIILAFGMGSDCSGEEVSMSDLMVAPMSLVRAVNTSNPDKVREELKKLYPDSKIPQDSDIVLWAPTMEILKILLEQGAPFRIRDRAGMNALMVYAQSGYVEMAEYLLSEGFSVNEKDYYGRSPLYYAVGNAKLDLVKLLLKAGAYIDNQTSDGTTALMHAVQNGNPSIVHVLLEAKANFLLRDASGKTVIDQLKKENSRSISPEDWAEIRKLVQEAIDKQ